MCIHRLHSCSSQHWKFCHRAFSHGQSHIESPCTTCTYIWRYHPFTLFNICWVSNIVVREWDFNHSSGAELEDDWVRVARLRWERSSWHGQKDIIKTQYKFNSKSMSEPSLPQTAHNSMHACIYIYNGTSILWHPWASFSWLLYKRRL